MSWIILVCASFFELAFTVCMKLSDGLKNKLYTLLTIVTASLSVILLSIATKKLPLGIAYAVWTGLGTVFNVAFGIAVFKESKSIKKLIFTGMVLMGVIGLRLAS